MLDINLGSDTSEAIARKLDEDGVPFIFASGYGERMNAICSPLSASGCVR